MADAGAVLSRDDAHDHSFDGAGLGTAGDSPLLTPRSDGVLHAVDATGASPSDLAAIGDTRKSAHPNQREMSWFMVLLTSMSAIGGLLFGYDTGVVSGAILVLKDDFSLSDIEVEFIVSATVLAAVVSATVAGRITNTLGRRPVILISAVTFLLGSLCMGFANGVPMLMVGRAVVGLAIGLASMAGPLYIAECAAPQYRGLLVTVNTLFITGGQFVASVIDGVFVNVPHGWRYMLGIAAIPATIQLVGFMWLPESPRHLVATGKLDEAASVIARARNAPVQSGVVQAELDGIKAALQSRTVPIWVAIRSVSVRRALVLGCGLQALQQVLGINTVMYYAGTIITLAGVHNRTLAIWLAAAVAFTNFAFTIVGVVAVDRSGRRKLTLGSMAGVIVALVILGAAFYVGQHYSPLVTPIPQSGSVCGVAATCGDCSVLADCGYCFPDAALGGTPGEGLCLPGTTSGPTGAAAAMCNATVMMSSPPSWILNGCPPSFSSWLALGALILYLAAFAPGMGPMPWTINAEIFPLHARSACVATTTAVNWILNFVVALTFLTLADAVTLYGCFWLYAGVGVVGWLWLSSALPETRNKSLEDIAVLFRKPGDPPEPDFEREGFNLAPSAPIVYGGH